MEQPLVLVALVLVAALVGGLAVAGVVLVGLRGHSRGAGADVVDAVVAVADERLGSTRSLIDGQLRSLSDELARVTAVVSGLEAERSRQHGELSAQLRATVDQTASLASTAGALRQVLANPKARGQWGERIADDVLRAAGLVEGVSYVKQRALPSGAVPDFTIVLPRGLVLHLDAKFPAANYARCVEASSDHEQQIHRRSFLADVRARVRELAGRGYVDPAGGTLGFVLAFIPNESIYAFVHEHDPELLDVALAQGVVLCSPLSLFAVLAVVRQAVEAFAVESTATEIVSVLGDFSDQWERFCGSLDRLGRAVDGVERAYGEVAGTRRRVLERPLARIEELRGRGSASAERGGDPLDGLRLVADGAPPSEAAST